MSGCFFPPVPRNPLFLVSTGRCVQAQGVVQLKTFIQGPSSRPEHQEHTVGLTRSNEAWIPITTFTWVHSQTSGESCLTKQLDEFFFGFEILGLCCFKDMCALAGALENWIKISPTSTGRMLFHRLLNRESMCNWEPLRGFSREPCRKPIGAQHKESGLRLETHLHGVLPELPGRFAPFRATVAQCFAWPFCRMVCNWWPAALMVYWSFGTSGPVGNRNFCPWKSTMIHFFLEWENISPFFARPCL